MSDMKKYVVRFFDELKLYEDSERGHCYKIFIQEAALEFLQSETKETAFAVYRTFFDSYRIRLAGTSNPFIDLLDVLKNYEENAATLIDKQRDHYIHSVNVFLLGLCVYAQNARYRDSFGQSVRESRYDYAYSEINEEFFYRWGIASLFHDVGYPVEIVGRQINKFIDFASAVDKDGEKVGVQLVFSNFDKLNSIKEVIPKREFTGCYYAQYADSVNIDMLKPVDLLAHKVHISLDVPLKSIKDSLDDFIHVMARFGFIDHGYYSAIIVLKWYGFLIQSAEYRPEYFFGPVLDSASAILLHNCYKNMLQKRPFFLGALEPQKHPIAYLLILCDELQEWNRTAYGILDKKRTLAASARLQIADNRLAVTFITQGGSLPVDFARKKKKDLTAMLHLGALFEDISIRCKTLNKTNLPPQTGELEPRPDLCDLESLAHAIHELYNKRQKERHPDRPLKYPSFADLPDTLKYSNLRQAMDIPEKLKAMGYIMRREENTGRKIEKIPAEYVEILAEREHENWIEERVSHGWVLGDEVDADQKTTPYLLPYKKLSEEIKQLDRDTIENIPILLRRIGMAVFVKEGGIDYGSV